MTDQPIKLERKMESSSLSRYDWRQTYDWNYEHAPAPVSLDEPAVPGSWTYCGLPVNSPLGIAAGPLLNGRWILYYASLGFDVLTYKTVRSRQRGCYPMPNLQPVTATRVSGSEELLLSSDNMRGSWAVSFGMPSKSPDVWRADVEATRRLLPKQKILSVSVVASPEDGWTLNDVAEDFARCARWAVESGADSVEANFSCPNVASADGQLYHLPEAAGLVAARLREAIGSKPLLIKIGHVTDEMSAITLSKALAPYADALVMVNCIAATVTDARQRPVFSGERRGIAGVAISETVLDQVRLFARVIRQHAMKLQLVGCGGIATVKQVRRQLDAGSHAVQMATAPMMDPHVGLRTRREFASVEI
jgi:dihydroorotate dehydrogenase (NAD+) catalytic subunit